jgi:hypothetical protein
MVGAAVCRGFGSDLGVLFTVKSVAAATVVKHVRCEESIQSALHTLLYSAVLGLLLATLVAATTDRSSPPHGWWRRVPWLTAGFLMSVLWAYTLAFYTRELPWLVDED